MLKDGTARRPPAAKETTPVLERPLTITVPMIQAASEVLRANVLINERAAFQVAFEMLYAALDPSLVN